MDFLTEWAAWMRAGNLSEKTIRERIGTIRALCTTTGCTPDTITARHIIYYVGKPGLTGATKATYHASIRAFTGWCVQVGYRDVDASVGTPRPKRPRNLPRPIAAAHLADVVAAAGRPRTRMMVLLAAGAGLRVHEIAKIHGRDLSGGVLTVTGKGGATKLIPLHETIVAASAWMPAGSWWFPGVGGPMTPGGVRKAVSRAMERAGVCGTPHQLRHLFGTSLLEAGVDLRTVQELMRHESIQSTQIYTQVSQFRRREAVNRLILPAA